jgi:GNAT superfamily N-acetyltransferase
VEPGAWVRAAFMGETMVGFVMADRSAAPVRLCHLMIDARYQGYGFGRHLVRAVIDMTDAREMSVRWLDGPDGESPSGFWERVGFVRTGEEEHGSAVGVWRAP